MSELATLAPGPAPAPPLPLPATVPGIERLRLLGAQVAADPRLKRLAPLLVAGVALALLALVWAAVSAPSWRPLFNQLADADKAAVIAALEAANYKSRVDPATGAVEVPEGDVAAARIMLAGQGLPKAAPTGYSLIGDIPLGASRAVEGARLRAAQEAELAASIAAIDGVASASVHLAPGEESVFVRDRTPPSASVFVQLQPGRALGEAQVRAVVHLVAASVAGLAAERVSVVDQSGALLSGDPGMGLPGEAQRQLSYQARLEALYRQRLVTLLTPILGAGNFTAEVTADVDFSQSEATAERYAPDNRAVASEQGSSATEATPRPARGIPGALSNTVPPAAEASATPPAAVTEPGEAAVPEQRSESFQRAFEVGRQVSVTRGPGARLRRLSVAVVVRAAGGPVAAAGAKIRELTPLVRSAVGYDAARGDIVSVAATGFAPEAAAPALPWYAEQRFQMAGAEGSALLVAAAAGAVVLVRRRRRKPVPPPAPEPEPEIIIDEEAEYRRKLARTRTLVSADVTRASAIVRTMIQADAP